MSVHNVWQDRPVSSIRQRRRALREARQPRTEHATVGIALKVHFEETINNDQTPAFFEFMMG